MSQFSVNGVAYNCAEQFMMAAKAAIFNDPETLAKIMHAATPREQKALGRLVAGFDENVWNMVREGVVFTASYAKFSQDEKLRAVLLATGDALLVEASANDRIWGIGLAASDARAKDMSQWRGLNLLGVALTRAREVLRWEGAVLGEAQEGIPTVPASAKPKVRTAKKSAAI